MTEQKDRRSLDRFEIPGTNVICKKQEGLNFFNHYSKDSTLENLSKSGVCLKLKNGIKVGDALRLKLNIPGETGFEIKGHVRWKSQKEGVFNKIGIQFEPFGRGKKFNPLTSLDKLREIQQQYN
jgi:PilZ domain-containing protein